MRQSTQRFEAHDVAVRTWSHEPAGRSPRKLVCFPFSGGGSTAFRSLAAALGPRWAVHAVNPPGHGLGEGGPCLDAVPDMVDRYLDCLPPALFEDAIVLGYSVGGYVAHHLLAREVLPSVRGLVMCAVPPYALRDGVFSGLDDDTLFEGLTRLGGIPRGLGDPKAMFKLFSHVVRADFRAFERCPEPRGIVALPTLVVAASEDHLYRGQWFPRWKPFFPRAEAVTVEGPHVLLTAHSPGLAAALERWGHALP